MLWVRSLAAGESRALPGTEGASFPFWSPDGRTIGFFANDKLKRIDVAGGVPLVVADAPNARGGTWSTDGVILFAPGVSAPIMRVPARGGPVEAVTQLNTGSGPAHRLPQFLPDGKRFLFSSTLGTAETNGVYLGSLDKTPPVRLVPGDTGGRFAAPDKLLTIRQGALQAYTLQRRVRRRARANRSSSRRVSPALPRTPCLPPPTPVCWPTVPAPRSAGSWCGSIGRAPCVRAIGEPDTGFLASPELSADEQSVVVFLQRTGDNEVWVIELARNLARRITDGPPASAHPLWDPDGQHVVFSSRRFGVGRPARQAVNGGKPEPLLAEGQTGLALSWTRDRRYILVRRGGAKSGARPGGRGDQRRAARGGRCAVAVRRDGRTVLAGRKVGGIRLQRKRPRRKCSSSRSPKGGGGRRCRPPAARRSAGRVTGTKSSTWRRTAR